MRRFFRVLALLAVMLAGIASGAGAALVPLADASSALQPTGSIEVHARICDQVPADGDWFGACHDSLATGVYFDAINTSTGATANGTTGANGNVTLNLAPGTWQLAGPPGDFLKATFIYCSHGENTARIAHPVTLAAGDAVVCDYYFVPDNASGLPTATVVPTTVPPTAVPPTPAPTAVSTAVPRAPVLSYSVVVVMGSCENVTQTKEIAAKLTDAVVLEGSAQGADDALRAATSYTQAPVSLSSLLATDHVIAVVDTDGTTVLACGSIGGVPDGQGAFTIGLAPVDDSGVAGTAYLASRGANATGISVFVVPEGLVPQPVLQPVG